MDFIEIHPKTQRFHMEIGEKDAAPRLRKRP
jgi:hypothetical protein